MCYPKPGPRCSTHTKAALVKAVSDYKTNPESEVAWAKVIEARREYYGSPAGIDFLRRRADLKEDPRKTTMARPADLGTDVVEDKNNIEDQEIADNLRKDADHYEQTRKEALAKYNRVKDLPAERREWEYDDDGYADEDDHDHFSHALRNVHTGAGEDYLAKNNLTDIHGWKTDDAYGDQDDPVWVDTPEGISSYDVRSVELYNVKEGMEDERRTIYRLDDGDGAASTFGSYEEAAAILNDNVGEVVTEEEAEARLIEQYIEEYDAGGGHPPSHQGDQDPGADVFRDASRKARETLDERNEEARAEETLTKAPAQSNPVKDLPADRQGWNYDKKGYADPFNHDDPTKQALSGIHNGTGEDYLVKNNLTESYGWATEFAGGEEDERVWVSTGDSVTSYDCRKVELYNVKKGMEGERREVYRGYSGDGYSTFGSREEYTASLQDNVGTVVTEHDAHRIRKDNNLIMEYTQSEFSGRLDSEMRNLYQFYRQPAD